MKRALGHYGWSPVLVVLLCVVASCSQPQPPAKSPPRVFHVGFLAAGAASPTHDEFRRGLEELGYTVGETILIDYRYADGQLDRLDSLTVDLLAVGVDVIVATDSASIASAQRATSQVPIVMVSSGDPVGAGFVASLARPGGNITGMTSLSTELAQKRLELLKEVDPGLSRVGVLWDPSNPVRPKEWEQTQDAAHAIGVLAQSLPVSQSEDLNSVLDEALRSEMDALLVFGDSLFVVNRDTILKFTAQHLIPTMYEGSRWATDGGLMAYGPSLAQRYRRSATYVDKILHGANPAQLPVEGPTQFDLFINLKTARALGITVPDALLGLADQVIS